MAAAVFTISAALYGFAVFLIPYHVPHDQGDYSCQNNDNNRCSHIENLLFYTQENCISNAVFP